MTTQAKPKTEELMDSILSYKNGLRKIDKFERNRLISDTESLRGKIPQWNVYDFFGMIECLYGNAELATKQHELAFNNYRSHCETLRIDYEEPSGADLCIKSNYLSTLFEIGLLEKCIETGRDLLEKYPENFGATITMVSANLFLGRLQEANRYLAKMEIPTEHQYHDVIAEAKSIFEEQKITDDEAEKIMSFAFSILHEKKLFLSYVDANIVDDCLWIDLYVDFPEPVEAVAKEIAKINWEADGILAKNADNKWFDVIMFEFKSVKVLLEEREIIEKKERMSGKW